MNLIDMEYFLIYLLKASVGIALFYLFYLLVLRNETFYTSNRLFLLIGLVLAVVLPVLPLSYTVPIAMINQADLFTLSDEVLNTPAALPNDEVAGLSFWSHPASIIPVIYLFGAAFFLSKLIFQTGLVAYQLRQGTTMLLEVP